MTRLKKEWIQDIGDKISEQNDFLRKYAGMDYLDVASAVSGCERRELLNAAKQYQVSVVPITSGLGVIDTFSESVASIAAAMGFRAKVTKGTDVDGMYEAHQTGADIVFMADDNRFIAVNLRNSHVGENNDATAKGFVEVLDRKAGGLSGKGVLILGYGVIGQKAGDVLKKKKALITVFDREFKRRAQAAADGFEVIDDSNCIREYSHIVDATSEGGWLKGDDLNHNFMGVMPGVPLSLDADAQSRYRGQFIHNNLEIGTAGMIGLAL